MCGIAGFLGWPSDRTRLPERIAQAMSEALVHRGPDDAGVWADRREAVFLAHRRLSVIDLTHAGHQPMSSPSGRLVVAYNGEIYNHLKLRRELSDVAWRGHSDTETLVTALERFGVDRTLERIVGMFAFAVWDRETSTLTLARDRFGEKPLYYGWYGKSFVFASELSALRRHPDFIDRIDRTAVALYLQHLAVPTPRSIFEGTRKLPAGSTLRVGQGSSTVAPRRYWSARDVAREGLRTPLSVDDREAAAMVEDRLESAVAGQLMADVPVGVFLSGGVDSSLVLALAQAHACRPVETFTIGFNEANYDEAGDARAVAEVLGSEHHEMIVDPAAASAVIPELPSIYGEPFGDTSAIPTYLVSRLARRNVTVSLTGDGGDELFGGYNRHVWGGRVRRLAGFLPPPIRRRLAATQGLLRGDAVDALYGAVRRWMPARYSFPNVTYKMGRMLSAMSIDDESEYCGGLSLRWRDSGSVVCGLEEERMRVAFHCLEEASLAENIMLADTLGYLPDDILVKTDRAAMNVSLETRAPFLDHRLFEVAWRLPLSLKIRDGQGKWLLRSILAEHIPPNLVDRPKRGFGLPMGEWLRGSLRPWAEELLSPDGMRRDGILKPAPIRTRWRRHLRGIGSGENELWAVLMFQAWLQRWRAG